MDNQYDMLKISSRELNEKMIRGETFVLIDTLPDDHFKNVHIPGAKNACVFEVVFLESVEKIVSEKEDAIVVYGLSEKTMDALTAGEKLMRAGYLNVNVMKSGLVSWWEKNYPLEGTHIEILAAPKEKARIENGTFHVNIEESVIEWTGRNPNKKHYGTLPLKNGKMTVGDKSVGGSFEIDMAGIKNIDLSGDEWQPILLSHLMSDDFFFVKMFPKAIFNIKSMIPIEASNMSTPNFNVTGDFELRGNNNEINFPATVTPIPGVGMKIEAHFDIDRTRWNVIYGSTRFFEHLGMHLVFDLISVQLWLVFTKDRN